MPKRKYTCAYCGKDFERYASQVSRPERVFCSNSCQAKANNKGKSNPRYKSGIHCESSKCGCGREKDYRAKQCAVCSHRSFPMSGEVRVTLQEMKRAVEGSRSFLEASKKIGVSRSTLKENADRLHWGTSHMCVSCVRPYTPDKVFKVCLKSVSHQAIKGLLLSMGLKGGKCEECGTGDVWGGKPLTIQLHHKNGNNLDNRIENLQMLCPNCHSQTPTDKGRKMKGKKRVKRVKG
jgi:hypothetical protein